MVQFQTASGHMLAQCPVVFAQADPNTTRTLNGVMRLYSLGLQASGLEKLALGFYEGTFINTPKP